MATWMNEHEVERALDQFEPERRDAWGETPVPNLARGARLLYSLMNWTNSCSDGWPYWRKPAAAAARLMDLLKKAEDADRAGELTDITPAQLIAAERPIKAFLTRNGTPHSEVFS